MRGNRVVLSMILTLVLVGAAGLGVSASVTNGVEASGAGAFPSESISNGLFAGGLRLAVTWAGEIKEHVGPASLGHHLAADPVTPTVPLSCTGQVTHPVGLALATHFEVPYEDIMDWHQRGLGFGGIVKAYSIAALLGDGVTVEDLLGNLFELKLMGTGWGRILKDPEFSLSGKERGLGKVMSGRKQGGVDATDDGSTEPAQGQGQGAAQGNRPDRAKGQDKTPPGQNKGNIPPGQEDGGRGNGVGNGKGGGKR